MPHLRNLTWRFDDATFRLLSLEHEDLDALYKAKRLPMAGPLLAQIGASKVDRARTSTGSEATIRVMDAFVAILGASLLKTQPWLDSRQVSMVSARRCGGEAGDAPRPTHQVLVDSIALGRISLERLASQHRTRLAGLVEMAEAMLPEEADPLV